MIINKMTRRLVKKPKRKSLNPSSTFVASKIMHTCSYMYTKYYAVRYKINQHAHIKKGFHRQKKNILPTMYMACIKSEKSNSLNGNTTRYTPRQGAGHVFPTIVQCFCFQKFEYSLNSTTNLLHILLIS